MKEFLSRKYLAEAEEHTQTYNVTRLEDESNWLTWKLRMEHMLLDRELMGYVDGTITLDPAAEEPARPCSKGNRKRR